MLRSRYLAAVLVAAVAVGFGAQRADVALAAGVKEQSVSCWADVSYPAHIGSNAVTTVMWQCSPGIQQQISPYASLTSPSGTRYTNTNQCYSQTYCAVTVSAPFEAGYWTARAENAYVVAYDGSSSYFFGGSVTWYLAN
jgi:hypothetical protein